MGEKPLIFRSQRPKIEASREGATNTRPALDIDDLARGDRTMPDCGNYRDSTPGVNSEQASNTWVSIGELASRLVRKAGAE